jgi:acyl carrier protein
MIMELAAELKAMIAKQFSVDESEVLPDAHLMDDLGADSLALLNLGMAINKRFNLSILYDDLVELGNVQDLVQLVESKAATR